MNGIKRLFEMLGNNDPNNIPENMKAQAQAVVDKMEEIKTILTSAFGNIAMNAEIHAQHDNGNVSFKIGVFTEIPSGLFWKCNECKRVFTTEKPAWSKFVGGNGYHQLVYVCYECYTYHEGHENEGKPKPDYLVPKKVNNNDRDSIQRRRVQGECKEVESTTLVAGGSSGGMA
jgi:hypothetical protein